MVSPVLGVHHTRALLLVAVSREWCVCACACVSAHVCKRMCKHCGVCKHAVNESPETISLIVPLSQLVAIVPAVCIEPAPLPLCPTPLPLCLCVSVLTLKPQKNAHRSDPKPLTLNP